MPDTNWKSRRCIDKSLISAPTLEVATPWFGLLAKDLRVCHRGQTEANNVPFETGNRLAVTAAGVGETKVFERL